MLVQLHVKNLALIDEEEITFGEGLNILTGETGAGKSIILGALNLCLGGKVEKDMVRDETADALVEAVFSIADDQTRQALAKEEVEVIDGEVILTRKIAGGRAQAKINGETVPAPKLLAIKPLLIDIYGQREHQSLLKPAKHMELLDFFAKDKLEKEKTTLAECYRTYAALEKEYAGIELSDSEREKERMFLAHEVSEIEQAALKEGEDEEIEASYHKLSNANRIMEAVGNAYRQTGGEGAASEAVGRALRELSSVSEYDAELSDMEQMLNDVDGLLADFNRQIAGYIDNAEYDGERFLEVEQRLNTINLLKDKYGPTIPDVWAALEEKKERLSKLDDFENYLTDLNGRRTDAKKKLLAACEKVSAIRKDAAKELCQQVTTALGDLNFLDVKFDMSFEQMTKMSANGFDEAIFMISLNPGEPLRPLTEVASGGELSRIMLALKTVLAKGDAIDTLIFDEIDAGISGRTAQSVSEKLSVVAGEHQVICITHLPQIAAMADRHFLIEKHIESDRTVSKIHPLAEEDTLNELARLLGGAEITDTVMENARELKAQAKKLKTK